MPKSPIIRFGIGFFVIIWAIGIIMNMTGTTPERPMISTNAKHKTKKCRKVAILKSSQWWASELGRPVSDVEATFRIRLWQKPSPDGKGRMVGSAKPGSILPVVKELPEDYLVISPLDGSKGYVSKMQIERTLMVDRYTFEPCKK